MIFASVSNVSRNRAKMTIKVYKRTDSARSVEYQDSLLALAVPGWPDVSTFLDEDRNLLFRLSQRPAQDEVFVASLALLGDSELEIESLLRAARLRGSVIHCLEEEITIRPSRKLKEMIRRWKEARRYGASLRGSMKSAQTRKEATAAKLELIRRELESTDIPTKELLARVGVRSVNSIKNHFGYCREEMRRKYEIVQKRKARKLQLPVKK